jgi:hypothetical protein
MMTTFTAQISALGQPSSEYCNVQQIAPKTLLHTLTNFQKSRKMSNSKFLKKKHYMNYVSASTCTIEYVVKYKSGVHLQKQNKEKNALEQCHVENS